LNVPRVLAGVAILVLAAFWAVVLIITLMTIGYVIVLVALFVTLLAIGFYGVVEGLGVGSSRSKVDAKSGGKLGAFSLAVLQMTAKGKTQDEIAAATSVSPFVIGKKIERLTKLGYIYEHALSEKGFDALKDAE